MPILTRWFVKTSLLLFIAALLVGAAEALAPARMALWGPVYVHLLVVGWITEMIFGVAYWMFPKYSKETPRGSNALGVACYLLLNLGLLLRVVGEPSRIGWALAASAALQWLGGMAFVVNTWPRIKER